MNEATAPLDKAFEQISRRELARRLGISAQAISQWRRVPVSRVIDVERETGVRREELRPDIYPPNELDGSDETAA